MPAQHSAKLDVLLPLCLRSAWSQMFNNMGFSWLLCFFQRSTSILSQVFGQTNASKFLAGMHSVDIAKCPLATRYVSKCIYLGRWKVVFACRQVLQECVVLLAKRNQNEVVVGLQEQERSSCVSPPEMSQSRVGKRDNHVCEMFSKRLKRGAGSSVLCLPLVIY